MKILPESLECEKTLIASVLMKSFRTDMCPVSPEQFSNERLGVIWSVMKKLESENMEITGVSVGAECEKLGLFKNASDAISEMYSWSSVSQPDYYVNEIIKAHHLRNIIYKTNKAQNDAFDKKEPQHIISSLAELNDMAGSLRQPSSVKSIIPKVFENIEQRIKTGFSPYVTTGIHGLDKIIGGFTSPELSVIAARPGVGKSALMNQMAFESQYMGRKAKVLIVTQEMSKEDLVEREISRRSGVSAFLIKTGKLSKMDLNRLSVAAGEVFSIADEIHIFDHSNCHPLEIWALIRKMKSEGKVDICFIDYLQICTPSEKKETRNLEIGAMTWTLKQCCKACELPIVPLSQVGRKAEDRQDKMPHMQDLRESGNIENDCDKIIFIGGNQDKILVAKHRNGPKGQVDVVFDKNKTMFVELDNDHEEAFN